MDKVLLASDRGADAFNACWQDDKLIDKVLLLSDSGDDIVDVG